jgi:predicted DCC family thiol-disulfide oxidoreductase YuxK
VRTFDKPTQEPREPREPRVSVLYDAECQFCRWAMGMLLMWDRRGRLVPLTLQEPEADSLLGELTPEQRMETWHLVAATGERYAGGAAFAPLFELLPAGQPLARLAVRFPAVAEYVYDAVSRHRSQLPRLIPRRLQQLAARTLREQTQRRSRKSSR